MVERCLKNSKDRMVVYDFVTPENLAHKYKEDGLFIDGSILFKTDPDEYEVNTSFTIDISGQKITKDISGKYYNKYTLQPSGVVIKIQDDGLLEISGSSLRISENIDGALEERESALKLIREINEYLTLRLQVKGGRRNTRRKVRKL